MNWKFDKWRFIANEVLQDLFRLVLELVVLAGLVLISVGFIEISKPVGMIVAGLLMVVYAYLMWHTRNNGGQ